MPTEVDSAKLMLSFYRTKSLEENFTLFHQRCLDDGRA